MTIVSDISLNAMHTHIYTHIHAQRCICKFMYKWDDTVYALQHAPFFPFLPPFLLSYLPPSMDSFLSFILPFHLWPSCSGSESWINYMSIHGILLSFVIITIVHAISLFISWPQSVWFANIFIRIFVLLFERNPWGQKLY